MVLLSLRQRNLRRNCRPNTENTISPPHASQKIARHPKWHHSTRNQSARPALPRSCTATNICPSQSRKTRFQHIPESSGQKRVHAANDTPFDAIWHARHGTTTFVAWLAFWPDLVRGPAPLWRVFSKKDPAKMRARRFLATLTEAIHFCIVCARFAAQNPRPGPSGCPETRAHPHLPQ